MKWFKKTKGFTLLEMMLVMVIISAIVLGIATYSEQRMAQLRQDRAVLQIQQILNAGLAYYLNNTTWPTDLPAQLQDKGYLPGPSTMVKIVNPWAGDYFIGPGTSTDAPNALFTVCTKINAGAATPSIASILAGRLPMAYVAGSDDCTPSIPLASTCTEAPCTVVATVTAPGQNLNNARAVNFAGIYHHGACVAVPQCPLSMTEQIIVTPTSVSGMNVNTSEVYPISSFTAYLSSTTPATTPVKCPKDDNTQACPGGTGVKYWRVCLQIITEKGLVKFTDSTSLQGTSILAITRCAPKNESTTPTVSGSPIGVHEW